MIGPFRQDLSAGDLRTLALGLVRQEELWRPYVRHDAAQRTYRRLPSDPHVSVWLICWMAGHD